jgi:methionine synthase II (cobalamin-independent)
MDEVFRAEVVGSLLRPQYLREAVAAHAHGELADAELKRIEDRAVDQVVALQEGAGVGVVTDGELRRKTFIGPLDEAIDGFERVEGAKSLWYTATGPVEIEMPAVVTSPLRRKRSLVTEEFTYLRARARRPAKATVPSPLLCFLRWSPEHSADVYPDPFAMAAEAADILRGEVEELARLGCTYVQVDAPELATLVQAETREWYARRGMPAERMLSEGLEIVDSIASVPGIRYGLHLCRGNRSGRWMAQGGYDFIAQAVFERLTRFDTFLLEYDDERSGSFEPLAQAPRDKVLALGLVSTKHPELEAPGDLVARIHDAARFFPLDQLALCTQCGFASNAAGNPISEQVEEAKLRLVADVAASVWD